jgi:3-hydroxymyristoyl/3-hydroxydecanoyl-(acyl carrier protein) dehydratase
LTQSSDPSDLARMALEKGRKLLDEQAAHANQVQQTLLDTRRAALEQTASLIQMQVEIAGGQPTVDLVPAAPGRPVLYSHERLVEFGVGNLVKALGPEYAVYNGRRVPRIPNGDLLLMSRALSATGQRLHPEAGNEIIVEYDVPQDAWYFRDNSYPYMPYSVYMEIALQPCGLLSAHLGTSLQFPDQDYFFRNLDGEARIVNLLDLRGKTITTRASLHRPMVSGKQIIQKFDFQLTTGSQVVFEGNSVFGFFPPEAMAAQLGRDGGQETLPLFEQAGRGLLEGKLIALPDDRLLQGSQDRPYYRLPSGHFSLLKEVYFSPKGGRNGLGYIYANQPVNGSDWFYACHFYQDPVMPGSLGVEAILEAMQAFALDQDLGRELRNPRFDLVPGRSMTWKYRGQILQSARMMKLEVHLTRLERSAGQVLILGDASLWADRIRIYELKDAGIRLVEG